METNLSSLLRLRSVMLFVLVVIVFERSVVEPQQKLDRTFVMHGLLSFD